MLVKAFSFVWLALAGIAAVVYLLRSNLGVWLLALTVGICGLIAYARVREQRRRVREGYYVYRRGGAEGGILFYNEEGRILQFYFDRSTDTIYIPSDAKWREVMPMWAQNRKQQIVSRLKQCFGKRLTGKSWTYEESDNPGRIVPKTM